MDSHSMKRDLQALSRKEFDLVVVGGGIFGVCAAWDAALRGLSVALVEREDFSGATSANHFKIVHGGIRYLQHGDIYRVRESGRERAALLRIAPHLVKPLPIVVPTYGHGLKGRELLAVGLYVYDLALFDRNRGLKDPARKIPSSRLISKDNCLKLFPGIEAEGLTGAGIFCDAQIYNAPRLALSFLRSAVSVGAQAANYVEAVEFLSRDNRVNGIKAKDTLTGKEFDIRSKIVLNASGPWAEKLLGTSNRLQRRNPLAFSRDACFIVGRRLIGDYTLALQVKTKDPDAILSRGERHIFVSTWRDYTLIGVWHKVHEGDPDRFTVSEEDLLGFLSDVNAAFPAFKLTLQDISKWNAGLTLFGENKAGATNLSYGKRSQIFDHAKEAQVDGLITLVGVRATTARGVAEKAINLVMKKLGRKRIRSMTSVTPIYGGRIGYYDEFIGKLIDGRPQSIDVDVIEALGQNYGSGCHEVIDLALEDPKLGERIGHSTVLKAEIVHAVRDEMAQKLEDVVFRRTDLATGAYPGNSAIRVCAELMGTALGWDGDRIQREAEEVRNSFPSHVFDAETSAHKAPP
jgi:glycerol-3-phosphate dehydrogenase